MSRTHHEPGPIPFRRRVWWYLLASFCWLWVRPCYRLRTAGSGRIPRDRPVLLVSNHQSFMDPILVGLMLGRPFWAMARSTLFDQPVIRWLIRSLNALPVARGSADRSALRSAEWILGAGETLLVFPEGTRSADGTTGRFARGVALMIRQSRPTVVPVGIDGAFEAWPRRRSRPRAFGRIAVVAGEPMSADEALDEAQADPVEALRERVEARRREAAELRGAAGTG